MRNAHVKAVLFVIAFFFATSFFNADRPDGCKLIYARESEISTNYGAYSATPMIPQLLLWGISDETKSSYTSEAANLKFIPDMVTFKLLYRAFTEPGLFAEIPEFGHFGLYRSLRFRSLSHWERRIAFAVPGTKKGNYLLFIYYTDADAISGQSCTELLSRQ